MTPARAGTSAVVAVLAAAGLLLVLVTWAASIGPERVVSGGSIEPAEPTATVSTSSASDPDPIEEEREKERSEPPTWLRAVAVAVEVLMLGLVALLLYLVGRKAWDSLQRLASRRRRRVEPEHVDFEVLGGTAEQVGDVIEDDAVEQRAALLEELSSRNAIVACWHRFELQAVRAGVGQRPWQTTGEFVLDVLEEVGADRGSVARLADLYREARFSDHPMTEAHRSAALEALDGIHESLRVGVGAR